MENTHLGDEEPLRPPKTPIETDRRGISVRWLSGSILTGMASVFLMGGALYAAVDGRQNLSIPATIQDRSNETQPAQAGRAQKGPRPAPLQSAEAVENTQGIFMVPTMIREGEQNIVKLKPFMHLSVPLAAVPRREFEYPKFDPLKIFAESGQEEPVIVTANEQIYGADIENEIALKVVPFPLGDPSVSFVQRKTTRDIEVTVRNLAATLDIGGTALSTVPYFDAARFAAEDNAVVSPPGMSITAENVSVARSIDPQDWNGIRYETREATVREKPPIALVLEAEDVPAQAVEEYTAAISNNLASETFLDGDRLLMLFERSDEGLDTPPILRRVSVYRADRHLVTVVRKQSGQLIYAPPPDIEPLEEPDSGPRLPALLARNQLPNLYNALYRPALNEGLPPELADQLVRIVAFDVDFRSTISTSDRLEVLLSLPEGAQVPDAETEILYASLTLGDVEREYYRFPDPETGVVDFYDETGRSAKQFLIREPVPNGRFRSPYGMRRHPITRVQKMHWGVDWSAPRGTPIIAAGNGVIEKAGWAGGYGRQTIIRHTNGYQTSYSHQSRFAKGIKAGARVSQGQVIGYVGSTGLSTGPHLHYEVKVNGNRVNPMKIKLPSGKVFRGDELALFEAEKARIDQLLEERRLLGTRFAAN